jgi:adenylyltransferase/sulfurtransferase
MILPGFGEQAQLKLRAAKILIVGMGGLGCPALQYLVGAGVGCIGIMDSDTVSTSNLHRQLLFGVADIKQPKVTVATAKMKLLDPETKIVPYDFALTNTNALAIINEYDFVIDATDNFTAKFIINDACVILKKPFVYGAVSRYDGQVSVFNLSQTANPRPINYRDLLITPPREGEVISCEQGGVIGVLPGIIGTLQAAEAIKLITGIGNPLYGKLLMYQMLDGTSFEITLQLNEHNHPIDRNSFESFDYALPHDDEIDIPEITVKAFIKHINEADTFVLDVRETHEYPAIDFADVQIPMSVLANEIHTIPEKTIYVICHQGIRSVYAAQLIKRTRNLNVFSVKGGLTAYFNQQAS